MKHWPSTETALSAIRISTGSKDSTRKTLTSMPTTIVVNASCEAVFANIVDAQLSPSWYPNSHNAACRQQSTSIKGGS